MNSDSILQLIGTLASIGVAISSLEILLRPSQLADHGLMSWRISQLRHPRLVSGVVARILDRTVGGRTIFGWHAVRLAAAALLLVADLSSRAVAVAAALIVVATLVHHFRSSYGSDGADQITMITFGCIALARATGGTLVPTACVWFLALQSILSYASAGATKALAPVWWKEPVMTGIWSTTAYGSPAAAQFLRRRPQLSRTLGVSVVLAELTFPSVLFAPDTGVWMIVLGAALAHAVGAFVMGLNSFFWAFVAILPAVLYCAGVWSVAG